MNFLRNLFGGGSSQPVDDGLYFYVRPKGCEEVVQVRINPRNDLSSMDGGGYFIHKTVRGNHRCFNPADLTVEFDSNRQITSQTVDKGDLVDAEDYLAWQQALAAKKEAIRAQNAAVDAANESHEETS